MRCCDSLEAAPARLGIWHYWTLGSNGDSKIGKTAATYTRAGGMMGSSSRES